jgi:hypothetical protein
MKTYVRFAWESCCLWDDEENYGRSRQAKQDNEILHRKNAPFVHDNNWNNKKTRIIFSIWYFKID